MRPLVLKEERDPIEPVWLWNLISRVGTIRIWLKEAAAWALIIPLTLVAALVLAVTTDKNSKVGPVIQDRKMAAGNIAGVVFLFVLAFAGIWVAVDKTWCWILSQCH